jgi:hypothetical protein
MNGRSNLSKIVPDAAADDDKRTPVLRKACAPFMGVIKRARSTLAAERGYARFER